MSSCDGQHVTFGLRCFFLSRSDTNLFMINKNMKVYITINKNIVLIAFYPSSIIDFSFSPECVLLYNMINRNSCKLKSVLKDYSLSVPAQCSRDVTRPAKSIHKTQGNDVSELDENAQKSHCCSYPMQQGLHSYA